jgi:hypothetical protein
MDADWISPFWQAFAMPTHSRVCGIRVPPLSVWHAFALDNAESVYMRGGTLCEGDALQLLAVATQTRAQFLRTFRNPRRQRRHVARVRMAMVRAAYRGTEHNPVKACLAYVEQSMRVAGRWVKDGATPCAVPNALHVLAAATRFGVPYAEAWDMPYATARALFDALAEQRGDWSIMTPQSQQIDDAMAAEKQGAANG